MDWYTPCVPVHGDTDRFIVCGFGRWCHQLSIGRFECFIEIEGAGDVGVDGADVGLNGEEPVAACWFSTRVSCCGHEGECERVFSIEFNGVWWHSHDVSFSIS